MALHLASPLKPALNRIAFVTGGAQGIGRAIACRLARDGFDVSIADRPSSQEKLKDVVSEVESYGRKVFSVFAGAYPVTRHFFLELTLYPFFVSTRRQEARGDLLRDTVHCGCPWLSVVRQCCQRWRHPGEALVGMHPRVSLTLTL